ncbi:MAG: serine/threonine protein kinase, partial [Planctomycetota bacterium]
MQSFLDMALALLVAERRLVEPAALQECILEQRRRSGEPLGQLLVRRRLVAPRDLLALTRAARAVVFVCATCRGAMAYGEVDPRAPPRCPRCGGRVAARSASGPTPATPASRSPSSTETLPVEDSPRPRADTRRGPSSAPSGSALRGGASLIGRRFGPYEVLRELGRGGMGVVYEARQARLERRVALKVLLGGDLSSAHHVARFQREAELAARLKHPNIARIHDVGVVDGLHYYAMDLIEGRPLADLLRESAIEVHRAVEIARDAARALGHAHRLGVVHRDVKPGNILVDEGGRAVVTDFGLARELDADAAARLTRSGAQVGTPRYMSPEQAGGRDDEVGPASDVFGLGVVLYELLTRRPPFSGSDLGELTRRISEDDPPPPSRCARGIPPPLDAVVLEALAKRPEDRYPSGAEFADDLERFLRGEPVLARARSPLERSWRWLRSRALLAGGSLAGGLLVAGLLLVPAGLGRSVPGESAPK